MTYWSSSIDGTVYPHGSRQNSDNTDVRARPANARTNRAADSTSPPVAVGTTQTAGLPPPAVDRMSSSIGVTRPSAENPPPPSVTKVPVTSASLGRSAYVTRITPLLPVQHPGTCHPSLSAGDGGRV